MTLAPALSELGFEAGYGTELGGADGRSPWGGKEHSQPSPIRLVKLIVAVSRSQQMGYRYTGCQRTTP